MRVAQSFDVGSDPDVLAFDPANALLYVAGERGVVSMFRIKANGVEKTGEGSIQSYFPDRMLALLKR